MDNPSPLDLADELARKAAQDARERDAQREAADRLRQERCDTEAAWGDLRRSLAPVDGHPDSPCDCVAVETEIRGFHEQMVKLGWDEWLPEMAENLAGEDLLDYRTALFFVTLLQAAGNRRIKKGTLASKVEKILGSWCCQTLDTGADTLWDLFRTRRDNDGKPWPTAVAAVADEKPAATENPPDNSGRKEPSPKALLAYRLHKLQDKNQGEIAVAMFTTQGSVSRWIKAATRWFEEGNTVSSVEAINAKIEATDPSVLDMGARQDRRRPRPSDLG